MKRFTTLLITTCAALTPASAQWSEPVRIGFPGSYQYPQIFAVGDTLHVVGTHLPGGDKIVYLRSDDGGDFWAESHILSDTVNSTNATLVRIINSEQDIMVLWRSISNIGQHPWNIGYALSYDNGVNWTEPSYTLDPGWDHIACFGASGDSPIVNIIVSKYIGYSVSFYSVRSTDFGQSWSEPVELFRATQEIWCDQAGEDSLIHYVWSGRFTLDDRAEIFYTRSQDNGLNWSPNVALSDSDEFHSQLPAVAVGDSGKVAVSWMDFKYAPPGATGDIFLRQSPDSGISWSSEQQLTSDHFASGSDIVLEADTIHVAWEDEGQSVFHRRIYYIRSVDNGQTWTEPYWIDSTYDDSWNPALAVSNGRVYIVWAQGSEESGYGLYFSRYGEETRTVDDNPIVPDMVRLRVYPNPFNSSVAIYLDMQKGGESGISIYDLNGRLVKSLFEGGNLERGTHKFTWDATDANGKAVSSGLYFAVATTPGGKISKRLTLIR